MDDLKPCPSCPPHESKPQLIEVKIHDSLGFRFRVECQSCWWSGPLCNDPDCAIALWNRRASPWQPIETAPRDGTAVLVWSANWNRPEIGYFGLYYEDAWNDELLDNLTDPTHWMPLPQPPDNA